MPDPIPAEPRQPAFESPLGRVTLCRAPSKETEEARQAQRAELAALSEHARSHVASKSATPVEVIALSGCSRPEDGRPCKICVGAAERHVRAVEDAGLVVVSAEDLCAYLYRGKDLKREVEAMNRLRTICPEEVPDGTR